MSFERLLESSILFILVFNILQYRQVTNETILILSAFIVLLFIFISTCFSKFKFFRLRIYFLIALAVLIHGYMLTQSVLERQNFSNYRVHDGTLITEESWRAILVAKNPYAISYEKLYSGQSDYEEKVKHNETDKNVYSPVSFWINFPFFYLTSRFLNFVDMRITSVVALFAAAILSLRFTREKSLFLILFLFNPVFLKSIYFGANDIFVLLFIVLTLFFMFLKRTNLSVISVSLAAGTKLLVWPFLPFYFIKLWKDNPEAIPFLRKFAMFGILSMVIYLPFIIWSPKDFFNDLFVYNFFGGDLGRPIAGFLGVSQILYQTGLISQSSSIPFFIPGLVFSIIIMLFSFKFLKKSSSLKYLLLFYLLLFGIVLSFSRIVQSDYIAFISQVLLLSAFVNQNKKE